MARRRRREPRFVVFRTTRDLSWEVIEKVMPHPTGVRYRGVSMFPGVLTEDEEEDQVEEDVRRRRDGLTEAEAVRLWVERHPLRLSAGARTTQLELDFSGARDVVAQLDGARHRVREIIDGLVARGRIFGCAPEGEPMEYRAASPAPRAVMDALGVELDADGRPIIPGRLYRAAEPEAGQG
ncbi:MAG: hypothetical protein U0167_15405 [bacterium]